MAHIKLEAQSRTLTGNKARKLRRDGIVPAVVFSKDFGSQNVQVSFSDFFRVYREAGKNNVIDLMLEGKKLPVIVHGMDVHPVKGLPRHVDFLSVNLKEKVTASVPVVLTGEALGVKDQGLVLIQDLEEIEVTALPDKLPNEITLDVTELKEIGDHYSVGDLKIEGEYEFATEAEHVVVTLVAQSKEEDFDTGTETIIEGEEGEGGEEVTPDALEGKSEGEQAEKSDN